MNLQPFISILSALPLAACAPSLYAEETNLDPKKAYKYSSIRTQIDHLFIINDENLKLATISDLKLTATIQDDAADSSPIILSFDWPHNIVFYLPENFNSKMEEWEYQICTYKVIGYGYGFRPSINRKDYDYLIEQRCKGDNEIVRYEYSDYFGLQSFGIGQYDGTTPDGEPIFDLQDTFALYGAEIGFGARQ